MKDPSKRLAKKKEAPSQEPPKLLPKDPFNFAVSPKRCEWDPLLGIVLKKAEPPEPKKDED